jgi:hypothetical protein
MDAAAEVGEVFDRAKDQAQLVGSTLVSFAQGVGSATREAISDSALLAQLVANKRAPEGQPREWFKVYLDVLQNVGWVLQESGWTDRTAEGKAAEVNEKILELLTVALGPAPAALAIITAAVKALHGMAPSSPWITLFGRESEKASIARFQISLVEMGEKDEVLVSLFAFLIEAQNAITQVLFFKFKSAKASFNANDAKVSINQGALVDLGPIIRNKVRAYQVDYLSSIRDI